MGDLEVEVLGFPFEGLEVPGCWFADSVVLVGFVGFAMGAPDPVVQEDLDSLPVPRLHLTHRVDVLRPQ